MTAHAISVFVAVGLVLVLLQRGLDRQRTIRCGMCGSLYGEKHNRDCPWRDRG